YLKQLLLIQAYDADKRMRDKLQAAGCIIVIPSKKRRRNTTIYDRYLYSNTIIHDRYLYRCRHLIENFFAKLKQYRAIVTRYDETATNFLSVIHLASSIILLN
ncbi:MAG: transposase, partial [Janthinobacterium lividum]